ncbi:GNAT family N-acetyltransferase [Halotalea alkalilenta]|uniref:GNAT family N-acetyltransferase n=1 Tax=Halotalea alkalilenta TaxID=376489 RepID=UPI0006947B41|nr:GNAT family N-acetyltransferase [Halotalea alkalilenta]
MGRGGQGALESSRELEVRSLSLGSLPAEQWDALVSDGYPFARHAFLHALEESGAVGGESGWSPRHLGVWRGERLVGALPCFEKHHSFGEYVFDWQWADAWERAGGAYYPKLVSAVPFTPAAGPRLLHAVGESHMALVEALLPWLESPRVSGWHLLFPSQAESQRWRAAWPALALRYGVQYHWHDRGYHDFEGFLATFTAKRRKEVRRERRKVAEQGLTLHRLCGAEIDEAALRHFYRCYQITYLEHGQRGYLPLAFFVLLLQRMPEALVLVQARHHGMPVACSLFFQGGDTLYGRYWGSEVHADCLHFEACYYQGIDYCLTQGLEHFDPGTQGEHKIPRGFEPLLTHSLHWLAAPSLRHAVETFLADERALTIARRDAAGELLPFRRDQA